MRWTPRWSPTTRPARPSTTTGICAAAATPRGRSHDWRGSVELDAATQLARRASRSAARSWSSPPAPAGGRRSWPQKGELWIYDAAPEPLDRARERLRRARPARPPPRARRVGRAGPPGRRASSAASGSATSRASDCRPSSRSSVAGSSPAASSLFIDSRPDPRVGRSRSRRRRRIGADLQLRRLADGRAFRVAKVYYEPERAGTAPCASAGFAADRGRADHAGSSCSARASASAERLPILAPIAAAPMTPAACRCRDSTIATVGSGVMAEAMIAGLLRGEQVEPDQIIASHPRADRRDELSASYGIRTVEGNAERGRARRRRRARHQAADAGPRRARARGLRSGRASWSSASSPAPRRRRWPTCWATTRSCAACPTRRPSSAAA